MNRNSRNGTGFSFDLFRLGREKVNELKNGKLFADPHLTPRLLYTYEYFHWKLSHKFSELREKCIHTHTDRPKILSLCSPEETLAKREDVEKESAGLYFLFGYKSYKFFLKN